jgi:hydroxymethylbilane synthase
MAVAAMQILGLEEHITEILPADRFVPAVGQGCVAVECRADDADTIAALGTVDHPATRRAVEIERAFLAELGSGCSLPVGAHVVGDVLHCFLAAPERGAVSRSTVDLPAEGVEAGEAARRAAADARAAVAAPDR